MSIEEKAKAYDEALKVAKRNYETIVEMDYDDCTFAKEDIVNTFHHMFPILKENEDERIRKSLIKTYKNLHSHNFPTADGFTREQILAWLEKQGEQKPTDYIPKFRVGDLVISTKNPHLNYKILEVRHINKNGEPEYKVEIFADGKSDHPSNIKYMRCQVMDVWAKLIEQKYDIKTSVEPKFKVGNWYQCTKDFFGKGVTFDKNTAYYCANEGCLQDKYGCHIAIVKDLYDNFKLWTIQDAKDGDVLKEASCIFIIEKMKSKGTAIIHCCLFGDCDLDLTGSTLIFDVNSTYPATKGQRNFLFSKIREAGYEWDAKNKKLNKISQEYPSTPDKCAKAICWSKEDENMLDRAIYMMEQLDMTKSWDDVYYWLKLLKK